MYAVSPYQYCTNAYCQTLHGPYVISVPSSPFIILISSASVLNDYILISSIVASCTGRCACGFATFLARHLSSKLRFYMRYAPI